MIVFFIDGCLAEQLVMLSNPVTSSDKNNSPSPKMRVINDAAPKSSSQRGVIWCDSAPMLAQPLFFLGVLLLIYYYYGSLKEKRDLLDKKKRLRSHSAERTLLLLNFLINCFYSARFFFFQLFFFFFLDPGNIGQ